MPTIICPRCNATSEVRKEQLNHWLNCPNCGIPWACLDGPPEPPDDPRAIGLFFAQGPHGEVIRFPIHSVEGSAGAGDSHRMRISGSVPRERLPDVMALAHAVGEREARRQVTIADLREICVRLSELRSSDDLAGLVPLINRVQDFFGGPASSPVAFGAVSVERAGVAGNGELFKTLTEDCPGHEWKQVVAIITADPFTGQRTPYLCWTDATDGATELLLSAEQTPRLIASLDRLIRHLDAAPQAVEAKKSKASADEADLDNGRRKPASQTPPRAEFPATAAALACVEIVSRSAKILLQAPNREVFAESIASALRDDGAIDRLRPFLAGKDLVTWGGVTAWSYHRIAWELLAQVLPALQKAAAELLLPGEHRFPAWSELQNAATRALEKLVSLTFDDLRQLICEEAAQLADATRGRQNSPPVGGAALAAASLAVEEPQDSPVSPAVHGLISPAAAGQAPPEMVCTVSDHPALNPLPPPLAQAIQQSVIATTSVLTPQIELFAEAIQQMLTPIQAMQQAIEWGVITPETAARHWYRLLTGDRRPRYKADPHENHELREILMRLYPDDPARVESEIQSSLHESALNDDKFCWGPDHSYLYEALAAWCRIGPAAAKEMTWLEIEDAFRAAYQRQMAAEAGVEAQQAVASACEEALDATRPESTPKGASTHADGPEPPHWLWWNGTRYRIGKTRSQLSWRLLQYFWDRESATYEDLQEPGRPWPDPVSDSAVATAVNRFKTDIPSGFPWKLVTKGRCVTKEFRENPAK